MKFLPCLGIGLLLCTPIAPAAVVINDGTTTDGLVRLGPQTLPGSVSTTTLTVTPDDNLQAGVSQQEFPNFPILHTSWYATAYIATGGTFNASADFKPEAASSFLEGGVVAWLNQDTSHGIVFALRNETNVNTQVTRTYAQVTVYDFSVGSPVTETLFDLDGNTANLGSSAAESSMTPGYAPDNSLRLQVSFEPPTPDDLTNSPAATARLTAVATQDAGSGDQPVTTPIVLLTTMPVPGPDGRLIGYYAVFRSLGDLVGPIGRLANLTLDGEFDVGNQLPTISLTAPQVGQQFASGDPISITADASDPDGSIAQVEFFAGAQSLSVATQAPYSYQWDSAAIGTHSLTAVATDNRGASQQSTAISIEVTNRPPVVAITSPTSGQQFPTGTGVVINADASDPDGWIAQVQFLLDDVPLSTSIVPPYTASWLADREGTFTLTAIATDDRGTNTTSAPVTVRIGQIVVDPAVMTVEVTDQQVIITWDRTGFQLQYAFSLLGPWTNVPRDTTADVSYSDSKSEQIKYYSLVARGASSQPTLAFERSGSNLMKITWDQTGYQLQQTTDLDGSWQDVGTNTTSATDYLATTTDLRAFFRLRQ